MRRKQVAVGCAGIFGLLLAVVLGLFYFYVLKPTQEVMGDLDDLAKLQAMNEKVLRGEEFVPPENGEITQDQLDRFVRVQDAMQSGLGSDYELLAERAQNLHGIMIREGSVANRSTGVREALLTFKGLGPMMTRAKELQVEAMNREGFSTTEYRWVRENFYLALGFSRYDVYFEDFAASLRQGEGLPEMEEELSIRIPEANRDRAAVHGGRMTEWHPFLVFGL